MFFLEATWKIIHGDPNKRGRSLNSEFIDFLMEDVGNGSDQSQLENPDLNDSGIESSLRGLQSPVENESLDWVSEILNGTVDDEEENQDISYILILEKRFSCNLEACVEHVAWRARAKRIQDSKTLACLEDGENFISLLDKWINIFKQKHFPTVSELSLVTAVFGRRYRSL